MAPDPIDLIERARGRSLTEIAVSGIGGWLTALSVAAITGVQSLVSVLLVPIEVLFTAEDSLIRSSVRAFIIDPLGVVIGGADTTTAAIQDFGIFGLIIATAIVLASLYLVIQFIREGETTDIPAPGLAFDPPIPGIGVEEEDPDEEDF